MDLDLLTTEIRRSNVASVVDYATKLIRENQRTAASNWLALAMLAHQEKTFMEVKKQGAFRLSKYDFVNGGEKVGHGSGRVTLLRAA